MKNCFKLRIISSNIKNSRNGEYTEVALTICFGFIDFPIIAGDAYIRIYHFLKRSRIIMQFARIEKLF